MSSGRTQHESAESASARSPFSERVVEKLDSFRGLFRASVSGAQVTDLVNLLSQSPATGSAHPPLPSPGNICPPFPGQDRRETAV